MVGPGTTGDPRNNTNSINNSLIVVLPGDDVTDKILKSSNPDASNSNSMVSKNKKPKLGAGLRVDENDRVKATTAGRLCMRPSNNTYFVKQNLRRYRPMGEDRVICVVEDRVASDGSGGDIYRVNIGGPHPGLLSNLSFEGATKRNKPQLKSGLLLYCRVDSTLLRASSDPTLSCMIGPQDGGLPRKDWMTNEGTYGELKGGTVRKIPLGLARELLSPHNVVLNELGTKSKISFEICVGVNGYVWVHSTRPEYTIMIHNAILNSQVMTPGQVRAMVKALTQTVHRQIEQEQDDDE
jgi:exosome complex component RRP40